MYCLPTKYANRHSRTLQQNLETMSIPDQMKTLICFDERLNHPGSDVPDNSHNLWLE